MFIKNSFSGYNEIVKKIKFLIIMDIPNIDGNVKSVVSICYYYKEKKHKTVFEKRAIFYDKENSTFQKIYYDEKERVIQKDIITHNDDELITSIISYGIDDKLEMKTTFTYDEKGNTIEQIIDTYNRGEHIHKKHLSIYDEERKSKIFEAYENGVLKRKSISIKDESYSIEKIYDKYGNIAQKIEKRFDENKKVITRKVYERENLIIAEENSYDENGNLCEKVINNSKTKGQMRETKRYNSFNKVVEHSRIFVGEPKVSSLLSSNSFFEYDEKGNLIKKYKTSREEDGCVRHRDMYTYKYNEQNNILEECEYDSLGGIYCKTTYEYDEKGNEIKKIKERENEIFVTEHTIEYY